MDKEREKFEKWLAEEHLLTSEFQEERNCFKDYAAHLAFCAWQAAKQAAIDEENKSFGD